MLPLRCSTCCLFHLLLIPVLHNLCAPSQVHRFLSNASFLSDDRGFAKNAPVFYPQLRASRRADVVDEEQPGKLMVRVRECWCCIEPARTLFMGCVNHE